MEQKEGPLESPKDPSPVAKKTGLIAEVARRITSVAGLQRLSGFRLRELFAEVFSRHSGSDIEEYFTAGSPKTTPEIADIEIAWPKPWIFFRAFLGALLVYLLFNFAWQAFDNITILPGLILTGSFAIPLSTLIFFLEINIRRNVSVYQVVKLVVVGGVLSFLFSLLLFGITDAFTLEWLGGSLAGLVEEPGKVFALLIVASLPRYKYILNGLLFGAAVGAGFAAFESAGYALYAGVVRSDPGLMTTTILLRGLLSPLGHVAWSAMCGAALWKVKDGRLFKFRMLADFRFMRILLIATALHMFWNAPVNIPFLGRYILVGIIGWVIILGFVSEGLGQLRAEKAQAVAADTRRETADIEV